MPATTQTMHWNLATAATALAGVALMLLQPQWWEGALYTIFQCCLILSLRPKLPARSSADLADSLMEEIRDLRNQLDERRELLGRVLPLWGEQLQQAQDQMNMPGTHMSPGSALRDRVNLILGAVRADMHRLCEIAGHENNHRLQPDNWLSTFAATTRPSGWRQGKNVSSAPHAIGDAGQNASAHAACCDQIH